MHRKNIFLKVLYDDKGLILGAQSAGPNSAEKRINYAAMAIMYNIPIEELLHFQVAYNPVVDTQRDVINLVARIARAQNARITENMLTLDKNQKYLIYCRRGARAYNF